MTTLLSEFFALSLIADATASPAAGFNLRHFLVWFLLALTFWPLGLYLGWRRWRHDRYRADLLEEENWALRKREVELRDELNRLS